MSKPSTPPVAPRSSRLRPILVAILAAGACSVGVSAVCAAPAPPSASTANDYRLGAGDKLRVQVFGEDSLGGEFAVSGSGSVALPLIGEVQAQGLTAPELQARIVQALKGGYLKNPQVGVEVLTYRPFYILGEVGKPGEYPYTSGLTVLKAVATAQGFTYRANTRRVMIKHLSEVGEHQEVVTNDTPVEPGDIIRIKERFF